ncbi:MAG TPA: DNA internalization-related competence protein ComEC/Rec2 [Woeseiaceae bacterium]|nr:DNA internalization-related competence protein ComEC/Rec2 [Woeseiaceae bacterium]
MLRIAIGVLIGACVLHRAESLPSAPWMIAIAVIAMGLLLEARLRPLAAVLLGYLISAGAAHMAIAAQLQSRFEGQTFQFDAEIEDFPVLAGVAQRLVIKPLDRPDLPPRIRLSWYEPAQLPQIGEVWQVTARLRAPRGLANQQGFDYEAWLFRQRIGATGYIVSATPHATRTEFSRITGLRRHFLERCHDLLPDDPARAVLTAVTIGARQDITRAQWDHYARTGTSHLMAISGLHVGLAAAGIFLLVRVLAAPFARGRNIRDSAVVAAAAGATAYTLVSGLAVPAQRALLMVLLVSATFLLRRSRSYARILSLACIAILAADPLAVLAPGFQLSFFAVALLLWSGRQFRARALQCPSTVTTRILESARGLAVLQVLLLFGLLPLTAMLFGRITWLAPFVNLLALPVFNLCTVPLALLALVLDGPLRFAGDVLLQAAHLSVVVLLGIIDIAAALPRAEFRTLPLAGAMLAVLWATGVWAALPPGFPGRYLAWIAAAAVILHAVPPPPRDCVDVHVLDVGQGLSAVAATHTRVLVFDAGPAFRSGSDTGELVLVPFLRSLGRQRIDVLVVSHADLDHAGGVDSVLDLLAVEHLLVGEAMPPVGGAQPQRCVAGLAWHWDGIDFRFLHPPATAGSGGNNTSCVLEISAGSRRTLLTGDIEAAAERSLVAQGLLRRSAFVVVPHHGSRTSSTAGFVAQLDSSLAVVSAGFGNRWGLPKPDVVQRWEARGTKVLSTATSGAVSQRLCAAGPPHPVIEQRRAHRRYWHAPP